MSSVTINVGKSYVSKYTATFVVQLTPQEWEARQRLRRWLRSICDSTQSTETGPTRNRSKYTRKGKAPR